MPQPTKPKIRLRIARFQYSAAGYVYARLDSDAHAILYHAYPNQPRRIYDRILIGVPRVTHWFVEGTPGHTDSWFRDRFINGDWKR